MKYEFTLNQLVEVVLKMLRKVSNHLEKSNIDTKHLEIAFKHIKYFKTNELNQYNNIYTEYENTLTSILSSKTDYNDIDYLD
jgi:hypothetical protein